MKKNPIKSITVNIIPKYTDEEFNRIWLDFHYEVQTRLEREKLKKEE